MSGKKKEWVTSTADDQLPTPLCVLPGTALNTASGVYHGYNQSAENRVLLAVRNDADRHKIQRLVETGLHIKPIANGANSLRQQDIEDMYGFKVLIYDAKHEAALRTIPNVTYSDRDTINLEDVQTELHRLLGAGLESDETRRPG